MITHIWRHLPVDGILDLTVQYLLITSEYISCYHYVMLLDFARVEVVFNYKHILYAQIPQVIRHSEILGHPIGNALIEYGSGKS